LLQLGVDFTRALTTAFQPQFFESTFQQRIGMSTGLILAYVIQSLLLLAVVVLFYFRNVYILFVAAISPLLALAWSLPRVKRYADTFIGGWFAALLIAPLDMLVLKFAFSMFNGAGNTAVQSVSNWVLALSFPVLLLLVPKQIWDASQAAVGLTYAASSNVKQRINSGERQESEFEKMLDEDQKNRLREHRRKRRVSAATQRFDFGGKK
jgi:signal transduction histidine kinase